MRAYFAILLLCTQAVAADLVPADRTAIVPREKAQEFISALCIETVPEGIIRFWTPGSDDLRSIEDSLLPFLNKARPDFADWFSKGDGNVPRWSWLRRQAIGVMRGDHKYLLIAYHCQLPAETAIREAAVKAKMGDQYHSERWKERPLTARDGGTSFFRVLFDPRKREFIWYEANPAP